MNGRMYGFHIAAILACLALCGTASADVKIKSRQTTEGQSSEYTVLIKGKRQRSERAAGDTTLVDLLQCDLKRSIQLSPQSRTYLVSPWEQAGDTTPAQPARVGRAVEARGGVVTTVYTTKDTGERRQMFGYTARRLITVIETVSSPDSCTPGRKTKVQTDGWYIDAAFQPDCDDERIRGYRSDATSGCRDRHEFRQVGAARRGYPLREETTLFDPAGRETGRVVNEVIELSKATLDAALFDVPGGYREVQSRAQLYASLSSSRDEEAGGRSASPPSKLNRPDGSGAPGDSGADPAGGRVTGGPAGATPVLSPKKAGAVRYGLAAVKTLASGEGMNAGELSAAVANTLAEYLKVPNVELVPLEARLPSAADAEAKQKECDFVIYVSVSHRKGGGGGFGGLFGKVVAPAVGRVGIGQTGSAAGNMAGQAATQAIVSAGEVAATVKPKDELTLDLRIQQAGGAVVAAKQLRVKAKSDGEDIITPLVGQAAQAVLDAAGGR